MAIYDVDAIREAETLGIEESEMDDTTILDNMLEACEQMMNSLNEHGGAHRKYLKMLEDKDKEAADKIDKIDYVGSGSKYHENLRNKYNDKRLDYANQAQKYTFGEDEDRRWTKSKPLEHLDATDNTASASDLNRVTRELMKRSSLHSNDKKLLKKGKDAFKRDFGGPGGKDPMVEKKERQDAINSKKKAIKETCLTILSVIDDI